MMGIGDGLALASIEQACNLFDRAPAVGKYQRGAILGDDLFQVTGQRIPPNIHSIGAFGGLDVWRAHGERNGAVIGGVHDLYRSRLVACIGTRIFDLEPGHPGRDGFRRPHRS